MLFEELFGFWFFWLPALPDKNEKGTLAVESSMYTHTHTHMRKSAKRKKDPCTFHIVQDVRLVESKDHGDDSDACSRALDQVRRRTHRVTGQGRRSRGSATCLCSASFFFFFEISNGTLGSFFSSLDGGGCLF